MKKVFELINKNLEASSLFHMFPRKDTSSNSLPLITISREKGSGGRPIAYLVAKTLGKPWNIFHQNIVDNIAKETDLQRELVEEVDEKQIPVMEQIIDSVLGKNYMNLSSYYKHLINVLAAIGHHGYAIIIGRGANFLFPNAFKVRLIAEMEYRIKGIMKYEKVSRKEAIDLIKASDEKRSAFTRSLYNHNPVKAHHYDLVIRAGENMSVEEAAEIIVHAAKQRFKLK